MSEPKPDALEDLLARCREGEQDSITLLVRRFRPRAMDWATRRLKDKDLAEDAVQEAFLVARNRLEVAPRRARFACDPHAFQERLEHGGFVGLPRRNLDGNGQARAIVKQMYLCREATTRAP